MWEKPENQTHEGTAKQPTPQLDEIKPARSNKNKSSFIINHYREYRLYNDTIGVPIADLQMGGPNLNLYRRTGHVHHN